MDTDILLQQLDIGEDRDIEFKSANGGLPKSLWETLSAFANTDGGHIVLGVSQERDRFLITGINNPEAQLKHFWDNHNDLCKLSTRICSDSDVAITDIEGHKLIIVRVPRAMRQQRPVYINGNPMTGSYKRNFEGDYKCSPEEVRQMLRDADATPQDSQLLDGFSLEDDLDPVTLKAFRQRFSSRTPDHPWLALDDRELLRQLGGWGRDRITGKEGLTFAGLLMFGRDRSILDALPHHHLDYQEIFSNDPEERWTYRLTLDGTWEANLFNFYYRVYSRLVNGLNVPFQLDRDAIRRDETHVHEALREALVNCLIHGDHYSSRPIKVVRYTDSFTFANPGRLRIPLQALYEGGISDPRNPILQKMFQMLGLGEKAGSGFGKILRAWKEQQWLIPLVSERLDLEMTDIILRMASLIPEAVETELKEIVGDRYCNLSELERTILTLTHKYNMYGGISNGDIQLYRQEHPREIGDCLRKLVKNDWLTQEGRGRGTYYFLATQHKPEETMSLPNSEQNLESNSEHYDPSSEHSEISSEQYEVLQKIAAPVREKGRVNRELVESTILKLCSEHFLPLRTLATLLGREPNSIRNHYISSMLDRGLLQLKYPEINHPQQAYIKKV